MLDIDLALPGPDGLHQLAGVTGMGWTLSLLSYLAMILEYDSSQPLSLGAEPRVLLYVGCILFLATVGLDRLRATQSTA